MTVPSPRSTVELTCRALEALGSAWRGDWSEFDGRMLRDQLDGIAEFARRDANGETTESDLREMLAGEGICLTCGSWEEHCRCGGDGAEAPA